MLLIIRSHSIRTCALAYATAAADDAAIVRSADFKAMIARLSLRLGDADNLPFKRDQDAALVVARLRAAGVPE